MLNTKGFDTYKPLLYGIIDMLEHLERKNNDTGYIQRHLGKYKDSILYIEL